MSKQMFNDDETYTKDATELSDVASNALRGLFKDFINLGYSAREISHVITGVVWELELCNIADLRSHATCLKADDSKY